MNTETTPPPGSSQAPAPTSLTARLLNIFIAPGEVFDEIKSAPHCLQNWLVPALIFLLASWVGVGVKFSQESVRHQIEDIQQVAMQKQFQKYIDSGAMTQAQVNQAKAGATRFSTATQMISIVVIPLFVAGLMPFWGGLIVWAGCRLVFRQPLDFMKAVEAAGLPMMIMAAGALVNGLLAAAMGNAFATLGISLLVKNFDPSNPMNGFLMLLEVFGMWALVIRAVGLAKLSGVSFVKAGAWVFGLWITYMGGMFGLAWGLQKLLSTMMGKH